MSPEHKQLVQDFKEVLEQDERVVACWLEGSLARKDSDDFSDIDLWIAVKNSAFEEFVDDREAVMAKVGPVLSVLYPLDPFMSDEVEAFQVLFEDVDPSMTVDVYVQSDKRKAKFMKDSDADECMVIFDDKELIKIAPWNPTEVEEYVDDLFDDVVLRFWHFIPRVKTAIGREDTLEAIDYYNKRLEDLITLYRIMYTPEKAEWGIKDIEYDLPEAAVKTIYNLLPRPNIKTMEKLTEKLGRIFAKQSLVVAKRMHKDIPKALVKEISNYIK